MSKEATLQFEGKEFKLPVIVGTEGEKHGYFNYGRGDNAAYRATLAATDAFFVSLGWLKPAAK